MWKDKQKEKEYHRRRYEKKKIFLESLKDVPCKDCGVKYPPWIMEFDHIPERGKKKFTISTGGGYSSISGPLIDEIAKCEVVCANCHANRTYLRNKSGYLEGSSASLPSCAE